MYEGSHISRVAGRTAAISLAAMILATVAPALARLTAGERRRGIPPSRTRAQVEQERPETCPIAPRFSVPVGAT
jgi:hypothetical protein